MRPGVKRYMGRTAPFQGLQASRQSPMQATDAAPAKDAVHSPLPATAEPGHHPFVKNVLTAAP